ncbi:MAG TPA: DUF485 domain-containing protein [Pseudonocardiaceae bacterium]
MTTTERLGGVVGPPLDPWVTAQTTAEFATLRSRLRGFVFPMTAFFLAWYLLYVLLAAFAHGFMSIKVLGNVNVGFIFGLMQFITTFAITMLYVRFANRKLDPVSAEIRRWLEGGFR